MGYATQGDHTLLWCFSHILAIQSPRSSWQGRLFFSFSWSMAFWQEKSRDVLHCLQWEWEYILYLLNGNIKKIDANPDMESSRLISTMPLGAALMSVLMTLSLVLGKLWFHSCWSSGGCSWILHSGVISQINWCISSTWYVYNRCSDVNLSPSKTPDFNGFVVAVTFFFFFFPF